MLRVADEHGLVAVAGKVERLDDAGSHARREQRQVPIRQQALEDVHGFQSIGDGIADSSSTCLNASA